MSEVERCYDSDLGGHDAGCPRDRKSGLNDGAGCASAAAVLRDNDDATGQLEFVRQQRMRWLEPDSHTATRQSSSQSQLVEKSDAPSDKKPNSAVSNARDRNRRITSHEVHSAVVTRQTGTTAPRRTTDSVTGSRRTVTKAQPAMTARAGNETERNSAENGRNRTDRNPVRNCQNDHTGSGDKRVIFGTKNGVSKEQTATDTDESRDVGDQQRAKGMTSVAGSSEYHRTGSESELQQKRVVRGQADASVLKLVSSDDHQSLEARPKLVADVERTVASISPDPPSSGCRTQPSVRDDLNVTAARRSEEVPGTSSRVVPAAGSRAALGLHDVLKHLQDFDKTDSGSVTRSDEVSHSFCATSLYFDEPLIEDEFDVCMRGGWLRLQSQGHSASESSRAQLQHDFPTIEPPEGFADTDDTLLKLPYSASEVDSDKLEVVDLAAKETQADCELSQEDATSNRPNVEASASNVKPVPSSMHLWSCIYSRNDIGVGEVSTRFSPAFRDDKSWNSALGDARTTAALVEGVCDKNEVIHSQASNTHSANSPVSRPLSDRETATNDTKRPVTSQHGGTSQELFSCTQGKLKCNSAVNCSEAKFCGSDREKSSADLLLNFTVQEAGSVIDAVDERTGMDSIDSMNQLWTGETNRASEAETGDRLASPEYEIPAAMEADFIEQMHRETCPNASQSFAGDFSAEMLLDILITHVVDARYFWGQIVNEGIQVMYTDVYTLFQLLLPDFF